MVFYCYPLFPPSASKTEKEKAIRRQSADEPLALLVMNVPFEKK